MLRATFFGLGLFVALLGGSFLLIDQVTLNITDDGSRESGVRGMFTAITPERKTVFSPPDWAAFSLMSVGSVTMLYSVALPKKPN